MMACFIKKLNPFYWQRLYELERSYTSACRAEVIAMKNEVAELKAYNNKLRSDISSIKEANAHVTELLDERTVECKQLKCDKKHLQKENALLEKINGKFWQFFLGFTRNDMVLINKSFHFKDMVEVEIPSKLKDEVN